MRVEAKVRILDPFRNCASDDKVDGVHTTVEPMNTQSSGSSIGVAIRESPAVSIHGSTSWEAIVSMLQTHPNRVERHIFDYSTDGGVSLGRQPNVRVDSGRENTAEDLETHLLIFTELPFYDNGMKGYYPTACMQAMQELPFYNHDVDEDILEDVSEQPTTIQDVSITTLNSRWHLIDSPDCLLTIDGSYHTSCPIYFHHQTGIVTRRRKPDVRLEN